MTHTEKHIVKTYSFLFESLSSISKLELIENLAKSHKAVDAFVEGLSISTMNSIC